MKISAQGRTLAARVRPYSITIGWLYPDHMSTYGDRGNIICLTKRFEWSGIDVVVKRLEMETQIKEWETCDMIIGGGAQDRQQSLVVADLLKKKNVLRALFDRGIPGLFVCGSPQLLGHYYMTAGGEKLEGLGIFNLVTKHPGREVPRCIGNTIGEILWLGSDPANYRTQGPTLFKTTIVGFENHGGRTYLGPGVKPFARVKRGFGNNGEDGYEGAVYKNVIACYYHGPFLPKNPHVADWLIKTALEVKYKKEVELEPLDDTLEWQAHNFMLKKMGL